MKFKGGLVAEFKSSRPGFPVASPRASPNLSSLQDGAVNPYVPCKSTLDAAHVEVLSWARHPANPRVVFINLTVHILFFLFTLQHCGFLLLLFFIRMLKTAF